VTSKLKTDVIETVSGNGTIALANQFSGMTYESMPSGSVVQVQYSKNAVSGTVVNTTADLVSVSVIKRLANSKFMIAGGTYLAKLSDDANQDTVDPSLMFRADGVTIATGTGGYNQSGFYGVDVPMYQLAGGTHGQQYDMWPHNSMQDYIGSEAAGDTIVFSLALRTSTLGAFYNRSYYSNSSNAMTYIQIMEVAQ